MFHNNYRFILIVVIAVITIYNASTGAFAQGPNMVQNSGFEGGNYVWQSNNSSTFAVVDNPANAYNGSSWELVGTLTGYGANEWEPLQVLPSTSYTTTFYVKGSGTFTLNILTNETWSNIATKTVTVNSTTYTPITLSWNSGNNWTTSGSNGSTPTVLVDFCDNGGGGSGNGTVYVDNVYTGLPSATDIGFNPSNPGASHFNYLIFDDEFNSSSTIDGGATGADGYNWYPQQFFGLQTAPSSSYLVSTRKRGSPCRVIHFQDIAEHQGGGCRTKR
jgi:hypothetical protein